jgi:hypothetical protein
MAVTVGTTIGIKEETTVTMGLTITITLSMTGRDDYNSRANSIIQGVVQCYPSGSHVSG